MLQCSTSTGFGSCRLLQWLGSAVAQTTWRLRVPELQLLEHWWGGYGERTQAQGTGLRLEVRMRVPSREGKGL